MCVCVCVCVCMCMWCKCWKSPVINWGEGDLSPRGKIIAAWLGHINTCLIAAAVIIFLVILDLSPRLVLDILLTHEMDLSTHIIWTY